jgi:hypothetical protein
MRINYMAEREAARLEDKDDPLRSIRHCICYRYAEQAVQRRSLQSSPIQLLLWEEMWGRRVGRRIVEDRKAPRQGIERRSREQAYYTRPTCMLILQSSNSANCGRISRNCRSPTHSMSGMRLGGVRQVFRNGRTEIIDRAGLALLLSIVAGSPSPSSAQGHEEQVRCNVQIANSSFGQQICDVAQVDEELTITWPAAGGRTYRVRLEQTSDDQADGYWNGFSAGAEAVVPVGALSLENSCWRGRSPEAPSAILAPNSPPPPVGNAMTRSGDADLFDRLERLKRLHESGAVDDDQFKRMRDRLVGEMG